MPAYAGMTWCIWRKAKVTAAMLTPRMETAVESLLEILALEQLEHNLYRGRSPRSRGSASSAARSSARRWSRRRAPSRPPPRSSLHGYFMREGDPAVPIIYEVDRIRDGKSFATRSVVAIQHGPPRSSRCRLPSRSTSPASITRSDAEGAGRRRTCRARLSCRPPISTSRRKACVATGNAPVRSSSGRATSAISSATRNFRRSSGLVRATGKLPDDPVIHRAVLAYASDMTLLDTSLFAHGRMIFDRVQAASLDHAMWFHRPFRADEVAASSEDSPSASGARGFSRAQPVLPRRQAGRLCRPGRIDPGARVVRKTSAAHSAGN